MVIQVDYYISRLPTSYNVYLNRDAWISGEDPIRVLKTLDYPKGLPDWFIKEVVSLGFPDPMPYKSIKHYLMYNEYTEPKDKSDNIFYHTTPTARLGSVMSRGLIAGYETPSHRSAFFRLERIPAVYFTVSDDDIYTFYDSLQMFNELKEHFSIITIALPWDWPVMLDPDCGVETVLLTFKNVGPYLLSVYKVDATDVYLETS